MIRARLQDLSGIRHTLTRAAEDQRRSVRRALWMLLRAFGLSRANTRGADEPYHLPIAETVRPTRGYKLLHPRGIGACTLLALVLAIPAALLPSAHDDRTPQAWDGKAGGGAEPATPSGEVRPNGTQMAPEESQNRYAGLPALIESLPTSPPLASTSNGEPRDAEVAASNDTQAELAAKPIKPVLPGPQDGWPESTHSTAQLTPEEARKPERRDQAKADFVGVWGVNRSACSDIAASKGLIPITIGTQAAKAGTARCLFREKTQNATGWKVVARCSDSTTTWTAHIDLQVKGDRLHWKSERGSETYVRCRA
jgi:hypothetical protein